MMFFKVLRNGISCNGGYTEWNLPIKNDDGTWTPGEWMHPVIGDLVLCNNGYHLCIAEDIIDWLDKDIYQAEYDGDKLSSGNKIVVRKARLLRKIETWNEQKARLFACWCVRNTPLYDGRTVWDLFTDKRLHNAVEVAERYANGGATKEELMVARLSAWEASFNDGYWDVAWLVTWDNGYEAAKFASKRAADYAACYTGDCGNWDAREDAREIQVYKLMQVLGLI